MSDLRVLVIDDMRMAKEPGAIHATTPDKGLEMLQDPTPWDIICLDHDMGFDFDREEELTIAPVMHYIETHPEEFANTLFYVVTSNPWASRWMEGLLKRLGHDPVVPTESQKTEMFYYRDWTDLTGY